MSGAGGDPPLNGGQFLLSLLQKPHHSDSQPHPLPQQHHPDPAVAALGPIAFHPGSSFFLQGFNPPPLWANSTTDFPVVGLGNSNFSTLDNGRQEPVLKFGSFSAPILNRDNANFDSSRDPILSDFDRNGIRAQPPGFTGPRTGVNLLNMSFPKISVHSEGDLAGRRLLGSLGQLDRPCPPSVSKLHSDVEESRRLLHPKVGEDTRHPLPSNDFLDDDDNDIDVLNKKFVDSLDIADDEGDDKSKTFSKNRDKDPRSSDTRGHQLHSQRMRIYKRQMERRSDIFMLDAPLIEIYQSLIPTEEEKAKQKQLLSSLERLVNQEWPNAKLYIYGSCANSFGVSKSDIDICFVLEGADNNKPEILLRLAEILESDNLQNVHALVRARVPIVKLMDPATDISCDVCINNVLAVVNTKLLRDYAGIDVRLRQLAFIVKHWAKSRRVNETYHGTLSSYAYVLMCIHFLQQRRPAILPCLQAMKTTYTATIGNVHCAFFDRVDQLQDFGRRNNESISQLVWSFFNYWAYGHDYANSVISVRTGSTLSKRAKDWTRRIGNDRHLICIEDPFETSHDLGRVVDKYSIKVLREEFERAAEVLQHDPNPCVKLFEPYVPS